MDMNRERHRKRRSTITEWIIEDQHYIDSNGSERWWRDIECHRWRWWERNEQWQWTANEIGKEGAQSLSELLRIMKYQHCIDWNVSVQWWRDVEWQRRWWERNEQWQWTDNRIGNEIIRSLKYWNEKFWVTY